ncbi:hypothetical protein BC936DRAFT_144860 [Jimgerdemannia flammicorona]|uniref:HECT-type E3 ubiquitin transferase n=1 Tax=Jimgerdemannia flammicorona TaxID=994334 RepID=A0A433DBI4_9FUNG|nr:hypothetical protein BC936DRAFT_144860 [Jimgerdemannia flammicorona]
MFAYQIVRWELVGRRKSPKVSSVKWLDIWTVCHTFGVVMTNWDMEEHVNANRRRFMVGRKPAMAAHVSVGKGVCEGMDVVYWAVYIHGRDCLYVVTQADQPIKLPIDPSTALLLPTQCPSILTPATAEGGRPAIKRPRNSCRLLHGQRVPERSSRKMAWRITSMVLPDPWRPTTCYINSIPIELLTHIFARLEPFVLNTAAQVCKYWRHVITDDACWRDAFMAFFGCVPFRRLAVDSWKSEYILRTRLLRKWERGRGMILLFEPRVGPIDRVHVNFEDSWMLVGSLDRGMVARCDPVTGKIDRDLIFSTEDNTNLEISAMKIDDHRIFWGHKSGYVALTTRFKTSAARQIKRFTSFHEGSVTALAWSVSVQNVVVSGGDDGFVKVWDVHTGRCIRELTGALAKITSLEIDPQVRVIAGTANGIVLVWDLDFAALASPHGNRPHPLDDIPAGGMAYVATTASPSRKIPGPAFVEALEYDPQSGAFVVSYREKPELWKYDAATGQCLAVYTGGHVTGVTCIMWDRDPVQTVVAEPSVPIVALDEPPLPSSSPLLTTSKGTMQGFSAIKTTRLLVTGDSAGIVCLWDGDAASECDRDEPLRVLPLRTIVGHLAAISALSLDGFKVISGSEDGWVKAWDPLTGTLIKILHSRVGRAAPGAMDVNRSAVRCIQSSEYQGVVTIGSFVKTWDFSPDKQMMTRRNKKARKPVGGSITSPRAQLHQDIQHEVRESTREIAHEKKTRDRRARELERMTLGLSDQELLDYAIMISRDEGPHSPSALRAPQNSYVPGNFFPPGRTLSMAAQEEEDLVRAVIASLEGADDGEDRDGNPSEQDPGSGFDTPLVSEFESASLVSGPSSFDSHSFDGRGGIGLAIGAVAARLAPANGDVVASLGEGFMTPDSVPSSFKGSASYKDAFYIPPTPSLSRVAGLSSENTKAPVGNDQEYDDEDGSYDDDVWDEYPPIGDDALHSAGKKGERKFKWSTVGGNARWRTGGSGVRKTPATGTAAAQELMVDEDEELQFVLQLSKEDKLLRHTFPLSIKWSHTTIAQLPQTMFNTNATDKKAFLDKAKADRLKREQERQQQHGLKDREDAARRIQRVWRMGLRRQRWIRDRWTGWDTTTGYESPVAVTDAAAVKVVSQQQQQRLTTRNMFRIVGLFFLLAGEPEQAMEDPTIVGRFAHLCKLLLTKTTKSKEATELVVPYHALLVDARYSDRATKYLKLVLTACWSRVSGHEPLTARAPSLKYRELPPLYMTGLELRVLLQYLDMKNFTLMTAQVLDARYLVNDHPRLLRKRAEEVRGDVVACGMYAKVGHGMALRINQIVKIRSRAEKLEGGQMSANEAKSNKSIMLWLTAVLRCALLVIEAEVEGAGGRAGNSPAFDLFVLHVLSVPLLCEYLDAACLGMMKNGRVLERAVERIRGTDQGAQALLQALEGNGCLFLLGNLMELWQWQTASSAPSSAAFSASSVKTPSATSPTPNTPADSITQNDLIQAAIQLLVQCQIYISDKHTPTHQQYHAIFKWYSGKKIDPELIPVTHFTRLVRQIEQLWSRRFIDTAFISVLDLKTDPDSASFPSSSSTSLPTHSLQSLSLKKTTKSSSISKVSNHTLLAIDIQNASRLYMLLMHTFPVQRNEILYRLAYIPRLVPQLWRFMNLLGPKGGMQIYLEAARRRKGEVEKEPLIEILKLFCEECEVLFLTLDDDEVYEKQTPFKLDELVALSAFLNQFYLSLLQNPSTSTNPPILTSSSNTLHPPHLKPFDPARRLLLQLHDRNTRRSFCPPNHWLLVSDPKRPFPLPHILAGASQPSQFLTAVRESDPTALRVLASMPHAVPFATRLDIFRDSVSADRAAAPVNDRGVVIRVRRQYVLEDGFRQLGRLGPAQMKGLIRVKFVNELGAEEIGIDQGGPFKEFISQLTTLAFSPAFNLFSTTPSTHLLFPSLTSFTHANQLELFEFVGRVLGKAMYEGVLVEAQFAPFLLAKLLGRHVFLEELAGLDEELWRSLTFVKRYDGESRAWEGDNVEDLGLTFATDEDVFGQHITKELKHNGKHIAVTNENRIEYVYLMADYRLNQQSKEQSKAFIKGFKSIIAENWLRIFSPPELQRVISGEDVDFDVADLRKHTQYQNGYFDQHPVMRALWHVLEDFDSDDKRAFLKFVTSCSKPPLGGFEFLQPPFTIRLVAMSGDDPSGEDSPIGIMKAFFGVGAGTAAKGRLPTSSTCFNLLKLPPYPKKTNLREKLKYGKGIE